MGSTEGFVAERQFALSVLIVPMFV
jgi:hypothetical protein